MTQADAPDVAPDEDEPAAAVSAASASDLALQRYGQRVRRQRFVYFGIVGAVVLVLAVLVAVAWENSEVANTTLHTFHPAPPSLGVHSATVRQQVAWRTSDRVALGSPQVGGTIVTYSAHTVGGRDARTGKQTWSYNRSDRTVCTALQAGGTTIAIYAVNGNCDELTALKSDTGIREWTRTLDKDGMPVEGQPTYQVSDSTFLVTSPGVVYAIDPGSGLDRWEYHVDGCVIHSAVLGDSGALISQTCSHPDCGTQKYCGSGPQLLLRSATAGRNDKDNTNADQISWNKIGDTDVPVSADDLVSAFNTTTRRLDTVDATTGAARTSYPLDPAPATASGAVAIFAGDTEVVWIGGKTYAIVPSETTPFWTKRTLGPPTIAADNTLGTIPSLPTARITVPTAHGIALLDGNNGHVSERFRVPPPRAGALVYSLGTGFLVTGPDGIVAYT